LTHRDCLLNVVFAYHKLLAMNQNEVIKVRMNHNLLYLPQYMYIFLDNYIIDVKYLLIILIISYFIIKLSVIVGLI